MKTIFQTIIILVIGSLIIILTATISGRLAEPRVIEKTIYQILPITKDDLINRYEKQLWEKGFNEGYKKCVLDKTWENALNELI